MNTIIDMKDMHLRPQKNFMITVEQENTYILLAKAMVIKGMLLMDQEIGIHQMLHITETITEKGEEVMDIGVEDGVIITTNSIQITEEIFIMTNTPLITNETTMNLKGPVGTTMHLKDQEVVIEAQEIERASRQKGKMRRRKQLLISPLNLEEKKSQIAENGLQA